MGKYRSHETNFKVRVVLEALKEQKTLAEIAGHYGVHPNQITKWKKELLEKLPELMAKRKSQKAVSQEALVEELYRQIGQLKVELDWLKKKINYVD